MTTETEDEKKIRLEKEAAELAAKATKIETKLENGQWTPEQITTLMTQLSAIQTQQATILEKLTTLGDLKPATPETPPPSNVVVADPLAVEAEQKAKLEAEQKAHREAEKNNQSEKPKKHKML